MLLPFSGVAFGTVTSAAVGISFGDDGLALFDGLVGVALFVVPKVFFDGLVIFTVLATAGFVLGTSDFFVLFGKAGTDLVAPLI